MCSFLRRLFLFSMLLSFVLPANLSRAAEPKKVEKSLDLSDLGFSAETTKPDLERQSLLDERTHKLKTHEILGPITWALMTATVLAAPDHGKASTLHQVLGAVTADLYFTTAYFSWTAPNDPSAGATKTNLKIHKALQWVTLPLMVLTPIAGIMAQNQYNSGQRTHGLAKQKSSLATALYLTYSASFAVMVFDF